jgi:hypothetical protein
MEITQERLSRLEEIERNYAGMDNKLWAVMSTEGVLQSALTYDQATEWAKTREGAVVISISIAPNRRTNGTRY